MGAMNDDLARPTDLPDGSRSWGEIFRDLAGGRAAALEEIYDAAAGAVFGLALWRTGSTEDARDVVQELFLRLAEQGKRLRGVKNPRAWLLTVAHRIAVDVTRRRGRSEPLEDCPFVEASPGEVGAALRTERAIDAEAACALLAVLPPAQRETVFLRHYADCTFAEIGQVTGVPTFTAASRYRLGIAKLRRLMEGER
jgi:RNA polymerase sigma-70 factor (ECF subfamily)